MVEKMVAVPQRKLDELEAARIALYALVAKDNHLNSRVDISQAMELTPITQPMWELANTKWNEVK
jgi:hypothetical protein